MKNKESLFTKYMMLFYGISGPLDEYKKQEMRRIGNNSFIVSLFYICISSLFFVIYGIHNKYAGSIYAMVNVVFLVILSIYISIATHKAKLTELDVNDAISYKIAHKSAIYKGFGAAIYFGLFMYLWNAVMEHFIDGKSFYLAFFKPEKGFIIFIIGGIVFGIAMYIQWRIRIKK
ncbi:DUF3278 domain-containing protein [Apilactobacillus quenuiae]|uniref:DUF3278 domain-containing protein n=1 Tax=Apilactobacillus quenuiae TaxID=2008377 RepID=UPI000D022006|nr:DUF3278 domain-containing protein [Apilactobacillus quenuiae]